MSDIYTRSELMGARPVFCVEFQYAGKIHRYSTEYITLQTATGGVEYLPTIRDFDYTESAPILTQDVESNIVMMGLVIQDVNILEQWAQGKTLEGTAAEFFYVLTKNEQVQQTYEERVVLYRGLIQSPQIGDPDDLDQFVAFSIESPPYDASNLLLDSKQYIDDRFQYRHLDTADGKPYPVVLGTAGYKVLQTEGTQKNVFALPAYCTRYYDSEHDCRFMVAGHLVEATKATIQDDNYNQVTKNILTDNDGRGNIYSYIIVNTSDNVAMPNYGGSGDSRQWWVYMNGGGLFNQYGDGDLTRGGDICRWALTKSGTQFDDAAWANLSVILNQYSFAGYITDPEVTAFEWLQANIIPHLPISVHVGANGLKPVLNQMWALTHVSAVTSINVGDDKECLQTSAISTLRDTTDLVNVLTLRYAKRGHDQSQTNLCRVTNIQTESYDVVTDYAKKSVNLYGLKPATIEADYIYDRDTAVKVATEKVRSSCLPVYSVEIAAAAEFGYLRIGDVLDVTIERYFVIDRRMIVSAKVWTNNRWSFTLLFE